MSIQPEGSELLMRLITSAALRQDVLANNIASQNLPGYRRRDVRFEEALVDALRDGEAPEQLQRVDAEIVTDFETPTRADGNNVAVEEEASLMRENRIQFELYLAILRGRTSLVTQAITSDR